MLSDFAKEVAKLGSEVKVIEGAIHAQVGEGVRTGLVW